MNIEFIKRELSEMKEHLNNVWEGKEEISILSLNSTIRNIEKQIEKYEGK